MIFPRWALLFAAGAYAAPVELAGRAIEATLLTKMNLMQQYVAAAYCDANTNSTTSATITCAKHNCPLVESSGASTVSEFANTVFTDSTGFVALDNTNKLIVVSFRGSRSVRNWITNFDFVQIDTGLCTGCTAHKGFWTAWNEVRSKVMASLKTAVANNPTYSVIVAGHSLGGSIATLAAADLRKSGYTVALYSFGAPRVAGETLSQFITSQSGGNYRITHYNDIVPRLPPIAFGYVHVSPEYYIDKPNEQSVAASDIRTCNGLVNYSCNNAWVLTDINAHLWYFQSVSGCTSEGFELKKRTEEIAQF